MTDRAGRIFLAISARGVAAAGFMSVTLVVVVALTNLVPSVVVARADPSAAPHSIPVDAVTDNASPPTVGEVVPGMLRAEYAELLTVAETDCQKGRQDSRICQLTADQVQAIPTDSKKLTDELTQAAARQKPGELHDAVLPANLISRATAVISMAAKASSNPIVRKLSDRSGDFAGWAARSTTTGDALTTNTVDEYAKAAAYLVASFAPPLGDLIALAEAISTGNIAQGIVAVLGMAAISIGAVFPPAGAAMAVGLAVYGVATFLWNFFLAKPRNWIQNPPGNAKEMFDRGASIKWVEHTVGGQAVELVIKRSEPVATQTLLLDSKWTTYDNATRPVRYTIPSGAQRFYASLRPLLDSIDPVVIVWQDGKARTSDCSKDRYNRALVECAGLTKPVTIELGRPAVLEVRWLRKDYSSPPACAHFLLDGSRYKCVGMNSIDVLSEGHKLVRIDLSIFVGFSGN